jgi:mediator of RNA polymerase II transcription subunit 12
VTASKVGAYFNAILAKKEELMTLPDSGRKKQQINVKDNFWPVTNRTKQTLDNWFKDLAGTKPLSSLAKKAPSFNKKEEIFAMLCENQVSMQRASWFIKLSSAYTVAVSEAKIKKRQMPDPATEWTGTLIKFLKDLLPKLQEYYQGGSDKNSNTPSQNNPAASGTSTNTVPPPLTSPAGSMHSPATNATLSLIPTPATQQEEHKLALKQWSYCSQLSKYMYEEGLLDKHEFLHWIIELLDKMRSQPNEDALLKLYLPLTLQYINDFVQSEKLSRKLAYLAAKKISHLLNNMLEYQSSNQANQDTVKGEPMDTHNDSGNVDSDKKLEAHLHHAYNRSLTPIENALNEFLSCPQHRDVMMQLSSILQIITLECPTALVWCGFGENRSSSSVYFGSPLDHVPLAPSQLPMPANSKEGNAEYRKKLLIAEENIRIRSRHAESRWCTSKWQASGGNSTVKILQILDALDSHFFNKMDYSTNSLETLYAKIFTNLQGSKDSVGGESKENRLEYDVNSDAETVKILCEWAVSAHRWGEHRAMAVAKLLDKRQTEVSSSESDAMDDKDSDSGHFNCGIPIFQNILMKFLDTAPVLDENGSAQNKTQFKNLIHLFSELIRHDVFSHDAYMCTLISRGDLLTGSIVNNSVSATQQIAISSKTVSPNVNQSQSQMDDDVFAGIDFKPKMEEFDDSNVDDDLDKLLQNIVSIDC